MSRQKRERSPLYPKILFAFTDHPITVWAGVILLRLYFEWVGLRKELTEAFSGLCEAVEQPDSIDRCDVELVLRFSIRGRTV